MSGMGWGKLSDFTCLQFCQVTEGKTVYPFLAFWNLQMIVFFPEVEGFFNQAGFQLVNLFNVFGVEISDTETELTFALGKNTATMSPTSS